jgi:hypothetical protein
LRCRVRREVESSKEKNPLPARAGGGLIDAITWSIPLWRDGVNDAYDYDYTYQNINGRYGMGNSRIALHSFFNLTGF